MTSDLWRMGASDLAAVIRSKQASSRQVVEAHLERIAQVNSPLNAITVLLAERALGAADAADRALASGAEPGPLHGVPMTVKENIDLAGSATTMGVVVLRDSLPQGDAPHIAQLKAAGAIPMARTNTPDFGMRWHTDNALRGATRNPWAPERTPGGSSGGEAAALATGMTPLGMGNDYAGSLRWPSQCCGTAALKPTLGRIPRGPALCGARSHGAARARSPACAHVDERPCTERSLVGSGAPAGTRARAARACCLQRGSGQAGRRPGSGRVGPSRGTSA
jgi:amidase